MAVVDSNLSFVCIDVGAFGRESDSNVFKHTILCAINIPKPKCLPNTDESPQPYVFVADEAFALHKNLLRPYPGRGLTNTRRILNYRISRARRTVECVFGVLSNKWRVLHTPLLVEPDFADDIIKSCCILHNFVRKIDGYNFEDMDSSYLVDGLPNRGPEYDLKELKSEICMQSISWDQDPYHSSTTKYKNTTPTYELLIILIKINNF